MSIKFSKIFKDMLTGVDNQTYDMGRILTVMCFLFFHVMAIEAMIIGHPWQPMDYSSAASALFVACAMHIRLKSFTEPHGDFKDKQFKENGNNE